MKCFYIPVPTFKPWTEWMDCPVTCGSKDATRRRSRKCDQGSWCDEDQSEACGREACPSK